MRSGDFDLLRSTGSGTSTDKGSKRTRVRVSALSKAIATLIIAVVTTCLILVSNAFALPEGREYEMVSPIYKGGYGVERIQAVSPNGESVAYFSKGAFAGIASGELPIDYLADRGVAGWSTSPVTAPSALMPNMEDQDVSSTLNEMLELGTLGPNEARAYHGTEEEFLLHQSGTPNTLVEADWEVAGKKVIETVGEAQPLTAIYQGGSADFCHLLLGDAGAPLVEAAEESTDQQGLVYEFDRGCGGEAVSLKLVGLDNQQKLISTSCPEPAGQEYYTGIRSEFNAISQAGEEIFFTAGVENNCSDHQLFVRVAGMRTLEISRPLGECQKGQGASSGEVPCEGAGKRASATFVGASQDGARVFFTTHAPLAVGETDESLNLYMATIGCPSGAEGEACVTAGEADEMEVTSLVRVSDDQNAGEEAGVKGVVRIAPDGLRAYFIASGDLLSKVEQEAGEREGKPTPQAGADNMYVYTHGGHDEIAFVASLCTALNHSGEAYDPSCPSKDGSDTTLWEGEVGEAQTAGASGEVLVFSTYAQLVGTDTDTAKDIYRYDVDDGSLERVSHGEDGASNNGNCAKEESRCDATIQRGHWGGQVRNQYEMDNRAISEDGSRIVFTTEQPLSPLVSNGLANVYEWHQGPGEGSVSLISSGAGEPIKDVVMTPEGNDIFFVTSERLVPQDTDEVPDIYDARINGGFPAPLAPVASCEAEACYGPLTNPAPLLVPGSVVQAPGDQIIPSKPTVSVKVTKKPKKSKKKSVKARRTAKRAARDTHRHAAHGGKGARQ